MALRRQSISVTGAAGGAGVATASARTSQPISGRVIAIHLTYVDSPPATTDVTVVEAVNVPALSVLTVTDANANGWFYPAWTNVGSGTSDVFVSDNLLVTIAQANNGDGVTAVIVWDDLS